jgi:hypothetical protein
MRLSSFDQFGGEKKKGDLALYSNEVFDVRQSHSMIFFLTG